MRTITVQELKDATKEAIQNEHQTFDPNKDFRDDEEGRHYNYPRRLTLHSNTPDCVYEDEEGRRCPIGLTLTKEELEQLGNVRIPANLLPRHGIVKFESMKFTMQLQEAHDQLVRMKILGEDYMKSIDRKPSRLDNFRTMVGLSPLQIQPEKKDGNRRNRDETRNKR